MRWIFLCTLFVAGCTPSVHPITTCPPIVSYSAEQQARAADELDSLPADAELREMMADYKWMRDQARVCAG